MAVLKKAICPKNGTFGIDVKGTFLKGLLYQIQLREYIGFVHNKFNSVQHFAN
jgi:hypothetical protein